jgi:hypothetical protein
MKARFHLAAHARLGFVFRPLDFVNHTIMAITPVGEVLARGA